MTLTATFPTKLRALRKGLNLSQEDFASLVGIAPSYVSMLERGQRAPALDVIDQIAAKANVSSASLVTP